MSARPEPRRDPRPPLLAIVGPTGTGKTALAVTLAATCPVEAISVDSRQVYRRMDIGTAKPSPAERRALRHHGLDLVEPDQTYDAARFVADAGRAIEEIRGRGRLPLLVGGTGLYFRALTRGLTPRPPADPSLRAHLRIEATRHGAASLHTRLVRLDPAAAARLHPRDLLRVTRALEVLILTGQPSGPPAGPGWSGQAAPFRLLTLGVSLEREALHRRLDARVDRMLRDGLVAEVEGLLASGFGPELPAMQGIGYRHLIPVLRDGADLAGAILAIKRDTRRYAKRQRTWFAREPDVRWVDATGLAPDRLALQVEKMIEHEHILD